MSQFPSESCNLIQFISADDMKNSKDSTLNEILLKFHFFLHDMFSLRDNFVSRNKKHCIDYSFAIRVLFSAIVFLLFLFYITIKFDEFLLFHIFIYSEIQLNKK